MNIKEEIKSEMKKIASRKTGNGKLVFRKETKTVWKVNNEGEFLDDTGITVQETN